MDWTVRDKPMASTKVVYSHDAKVIRDATKAKMDAEREARKAREAPKIAAGERVFNNMEKLLAGASTLDEMGIEPHEPPGAIEITCAEAVALAHYLADQPIEKRKRFYHGRGGLVDATYRGIRLKLVDSFDPNREDQVPWHTVGCLTAEDLEF